MELFTHDDFLKMQLDKLSNTHDKSPNSFSYDVLSAASIVDIELQRRINEIFLKLDVDNLEGNELEKRVFQIAGVIRKDATRAFGKVKVRGVVGTKIPDGTIFLGKNGEKYYSFSEEVINSDGEVDIFIYSFEYGKKGNVEKNYVNSLESWITGVDSVTNLMEISGGYDAENDYELRERYYWKIQNPPKAGNPDHYKLWAEEVDGVGYAKVFRTWKGPSTVKVVVIGKDKKGVAHEMIEKIKSHIMKEAPIAWENLEVVSGKEKKINISAKLTLESGYMIGEVKKNIKDSIEIYLSKLAFKKSFVSYAKIGQAILESSGVSDFDDLRINSIQDNIDLEDEEVGVVGEIEVDDV